MPPSTSPDPAFAAFSAEHPELELRARFVTAGSIRLHLVEAGPASTPPLFLLHGFPEFWWGWRRQIPALVASGHRVVAPDLRGYNLSDKPRGIRAYGLQALTEDLLALFDSFGVERARVVAHDWGGAVAWWAAQEHPERFDRLAILNVPHPSVIRSALWRSPELRRRTRYLFFFLLPFLPERRIRRAGFRAFRSIFKRSSLPGTFAPEELDRYILAASRPGALTAMLHWYRAAFWCAPRRRRPGPIQPPIRLIWGMQDVAMLPELIEPSAARCAEVEVFRVDEAGHWVHHEAPGRVNRTLLDFFG